MWMTVMAAALGASGVFGAASDTPAPPTAEQADARSFAAFAAMADKPPGANANADPGEAGKVGVIYFVGKLRGRNPAIDLESALRDALPALQAAPDGEIKRCSTELSEMGTALSTAGSALQKTP